MSAVLNEAKSDTPLSVVLRMDETIRAQLRAGEGAITIAESFNLDPADPGSAEIANLANQELRSIRARAAAIEKARVGFVAPARQIIDHAQTLFKPALEGLAKAESIIKNRLLTWQRGRDDIAARERAKAEAEARRIREEAEKRAAAERAKAEEAEREARQKAAAAEAERARAAQEAERLRREGDAKAAAEQERIAKQKAAEQARQQEQERIAREEGERKARDAQLKAAAEAEAKERAAAEQQPDAELAGFGSRDKWMAKIDPGKTEQDVVLAICLQVADGRTDLLTLLKLDTKAADKLAAAQKTLMKVPGMKAVNNPVGVSRGR